MDEKKNCVAIDGLSLSTEQRLTIGAYNSTNDF